MATLPDLVLLEVFCRLSTQKLLRVREVCRRWRDLALEPAVWRHREWIVRIPSNPPNPPTQHRRLLRHETVLRLAPCLRKLCVVAEGKLRGRSSARTAVLNSLAGTDCAAEELRLEIDRLTICTRILQRQVALGRLAKVNLRFLFREEPHSVMFQIEPKDLKGLSGLLMALATSGVEELQLGKLGCFDEPYISGTVGEAVDACSGVAVAASLKKLSFLPCYVLSVISAFLVRTHAASLEEIRLPVSPLLWAQPLFSGFPALPNLRRLEGLILADMTLLLSSPHLQSLLLILDDDILNHPSCLASAAQFFRKATQLQNLELRFICEESVAVMSDPALLDMLSAIGASGCSALESLSLDLGYVADEDLDESEDPVLWRLVVEVLPEAVADVLPGLPHLRTLRLNLKCRSFEPLPSLMAAAGAHPRLEMLRLEMLPLNECPQTFSDRDEVQSALLSNPRLHVLIFRSSPVRIEMGMYSHPDSHPDSQPCSLHHRLVRNQPWVRLVGQPCGSGGSPSQPSP